MAEKTVKEALKKVEDRLDCAICLQPYTDPKLLPCFHVFCKHCLERIVVQDQDGSKITCPKCRRPAPLPLKGVTALQSAFYINHLIDIRDTLEKAKEPQKTQCDYTPSNKENSPRNVMNVMNVMKVMNEFTGQGKRLITEITTPDFF